MGLFAHLTPVTMGSIYSVLVGQSKPCDIEEPQRGEGISTSAPRRREIEQVLEELRVLIEKMGKPVCRRHHAYFKSGQEMHAY